MKTEKEIRKELRSWEMKYLRAKKNQDGILVEFYLSKLNALKWVLEVD